MSLPSCGSKNPVIGVIRCPFCNAVATVHETKRKGKHKYVICPQCGIDQKTGEYYQAYVLKNMKLSVNELPEFAPSLLKQPKSTEIKPTEPTKSTEIKPTEPTKSTEIKPTEPTEPTKSTEIKPTEPTKSTEIKPTKSTEIKPMNNNIIFIIAGVVALLVGGVVMFTSKNKKA